MHTNPQKYDDYQTRYVYTPLGEASLGHTEPYNVYGVVLDASAPYIKNKPTCQVRLIDRSLNQRAAGLNPSSDFAGKAANASTYGAVQFYAN